MRVDSNPDRFTVDYGRINPSDPPEVQVEQFQKWLDRHPNAKVFVDNSIWEEVMPVVTQLFRNHQVESSPFLRRGEIIGIDPDCFYPPKGVGMRCRTYERERGSDSSRIGS